jgi:hypothetical protein
MQTSRRTFLAGVAGVAAMARPARAQSTLQALHDAALAADAPLDLPAGTYWIDQPLVWNPRVTLRGAGVDRTFIKPSQAMAALVTASNAITTVTHGGLSDLTLDGCGAGCDGLSLSLVARVELARLRMTRCRFGLKGAGIVSIVAERVELQSSFIGAYLTASQGGEQCSYTSFRDCVFTSNTGWGWLADCSAGSVLEHTEFYNNGTPGQDGGGIGIADACRYGEGKALTLRDAWMENNHGQAAIRIYAPQSAVAMHTIADVSIFGGSRRWGIRINGNGPIQTGYHLEDVAAQGASEADVSEGGPLCVRRVTGALIAGVTAYQS